MVLIYCSPHQVACRWLAPRRVALAGPRVKAPETRVACAAGACGPHPACRCRACGAESQSRAEDRSGLLGAPNRDRLTNIVFFYTITRVR
eukprot:5508232-Prymnesium_polylepis.1